MAAIPVRCFGAKQVRLTVFGTESVL